jgi:mono/diheme cytochrome c family protein
VRIRVKLVAAGTLLLAGALALAGAEKPDGPALFAKRCASCHGLDGKGTPAKKTPDFTDPKWQASFKAAEYVVKLKERRDGANPPASVAGLKDEEIQAIVAYIRTLSSKKK